MNAERRVTIAKAVGAFGVRGEVRVISMTQDPADMFNYGTLYKDDVPCIILGKRPLKDDAFAVRFEGVNDRDVAQNFKGLLQVPRDRLPPPDEDEFYHADLIGLDVRVDDVWCGRIQAVQNHGAGDLLDIIGEDHRMWSVPFTRADVPTICFAEGYVTLNPETAAVLRPAVGNDASTD